MRQRDALAAAYAATAYVVADGFRRLRLRIGRRSAEADRLLARRRAREAYLLSADNPGSLRRPEAVNRLARRRLPAGLAAEAWADDGEWPAERGVLAFLDERRARSLMWRLRQRACLRVARGRAPVLLWSRAGYFGR
jgi:hypothetical protein